MLTKEQYKMIEHSYKNGDELVFKIEDRAFICFGGITYHKNKTYTLKDCSEVDITCFEKDGTEYWGDFLPKTYNITVKDPYNGKTKNSCLIASQYYKQDIIRGVKI